MKLLLFISAILISFTNCLAQVNSQKKQTKVRLLKYTSLPCDGPYDPHRLQNRITSFKSHHNVTSITVNFSDNCIARFRPVIKFKNNKLILLPYVKYIGESIPCIHCFSINYEIKGLENKNYEIYFRNEKVELSDNHYKTVEPSQETYNGEIINRVNKYGFKEGKWIEFYEDGVLERVIKYPENSIYDEPRREWSKQFSKSGKLIGFNRKDTTESWYEDGELQSQIIKYSSGDTLCEKGFKKYENRQLQEKYIKRYYHLILRSKFDTTYKGKGGRTDYSHKEEYYLNGQPKYLQKGDTSYTWFENGKLESKKYESGNFKYNGYGKLIERIFHWKERGVKGWGDLDYSLFVDYDNNGNLYRIHLAREEAGESFGLGPSVHYYWAWDKEFHLIQAPERWKEAYPWEKFHELKLLLTKYQLR